MNIGMTSLTLRNENAENVIKYAKEAGLSGIEWGVAENHMPLLDKEQAEKIKKMSEESGIKIFSLGSYCKMTSKEDCDKTLLTAVMLGAPVIRLWAGEKSPENADESYISMIVENTLYMAKKAEEYSIKLGFEYHNGTLTQESASAVDFMKRVNRENVGLYWQPVGALSAEENKAAFSDVLPYAIGNLHIHNHSVETGYKKLSEIEENIKLYYNDIKDEPFNLLIEFVKDSNIQNLKDDAKTLKTALNI